jgi:hypothetical protein
MAGGELRSAFVVFPDFVVLRLAGLAAQLSLFENVALGITVQLEEPRFVSAIQPIGQNDEYLSFHNIAEMLKDLERKARRQSFWLENDRCTNFRPV